MEGKMIFINFIFLTSVAALASAKNLEPKAISSITTLVNVDCRKTHDRAVLSEEYNGYGYFFHVKTSGDNLGWKLNIPSRDITVVTQSGELRFGSVFLGTLPIYVPNSEESLKLNSYCEKYPESVSGNPYSPIRINPDLKFSVQIQKQECDHQGGTIPFLDPGYYVIVTEALAILIDGKSQYTTNLNWTSSQTYETKSECNAHMRTW